MIILKVSFVLKTQEPEEEHRNTLEKVVNIPLVSLRFEEGPLVNAIRKLVDKI